MFYSEVLLAKRGPLARVWLASNMDRRLTKRDCLQQDLEDSIELIVDESSAPMALRLSGQLLLGVVKIYKRKTGYLLEDCNEALVKIKLAFRPGNVDLPADQSHIAAAEALNLPDRMTAVDLFADLADPDLLLSQPIRRNINDNDEPLNWGTQSLLTDTLEPQPPKRPNILLEDDDLELDLGDDDITLEVGRRAATPLADARRDQSLLLEDDDLQLDFGDDKPMGGADITGLPTFADEDIPMDGLELEPTLQLDGLTPAPERNHTRASGSPPLSDLRPSQERDLEQSVFRPNDESALYDDSEEVAIAAAQRVKRRKLIRIDKDLEIANNIIKMQQTDHSKITKAPQFLPRDPLLLQLLQMQKSGGFAASIFGDGRSSGWAPELRSVLSVDLIRSSGERKRKRDSGVADLFSDEEEQDKEAEDEEQQQDEELPQFNEDGAVQGLQDDTLGDLGPGSPANFDETTMPLLHPADAGPVSTGTKAAVHMLRERFGPEGADSSSHRQKNSVLLQDLVPEKRATKKDATKMFFEVLVLATKDAVKVEQESRKGSNVLGGPIRIRAKRGLYGAWAEAAESQAPGGSLEAGAVVAAPAEVAAAA